MASPIPIAPPVTSHNLVIQVNPLLFVPIHAAHLLYDTEEKVRDSTRMDTQNAHILRTAFLNIEINAKHDEQRQIFGKNLLKHPAAAVFQLHFTLDISCNKSFTGGRQCPIINKANTLLQCDKPIQLTGFQNGYTGLMMYNL